MKQVFTNRSWSCAK